MNWKDQRPLGAERLTELARKTAAAGPDRPGVWIALGRMFRDGGHDREAAELLEEAIKRLPADPELRVALAEAYAGLGRFEDALGQLDLALRIDPEERSARLLQFSLLFKAGRLREAERLADDVARLNPLQPNLYELWAHQADTPEGIRDLLARCEAALAHRRLCANAVYFKALAHALLGEDEAARAALSVDRFVEIVLLPPPEGYETGEAFRAALAAEILSNPTLASDPRGKATRGGRQTRSLRQPDAPAVDALLRQIAAATDAYSERLAPDSSLARVRPETVRLEAWAVVCGPEGQQNPHRHAQGWVSGVYYVAASRPAGEASYRGSLRLGVLPERHGLQPPWGTREIEPVPGRLVLFPSHLPHSTEASGVDEARISVAFDVVPVS